MSGSGSGSGPLQPTWHGFIQNSMDGLVLFEACLSGKLHHVPRRPHDRERASLIKSGSVFIYEENASGIKRWTDGVAWSPSRILGNFLIYRELEKPFPPGEKKRAMKRKRSSQEPEGRRESEDNEVAEYNRLPPTPPSPANPSDAKSAAPGATDSEKEVERQLIGSLVDSYGFRPNGLVKKTMSISLNGVSHHLVSYYTVEDVKQRKLQRPLTDTRLNGIAIRPELYLKQNFRAPVEEQDQFAVDHSGHAYPQLGYSHMVAPSGYMMRQSYVAPGYPPMYGAAPVSTGAGVYNSLPATAPAPSWPQSYSAAPSEQSYNAYYSRADASTPQTSTNSYTPMPPMQSQYQSPMRTPAQSYGPPSTMTTSSTPVATQSQYQPAQTATATQYQPTSYGVQPSSHQSASPQQSSMRSPPVGPPPSTMNAYSSRSNLPNNLPSMSSYRQYTSQSGGSQGEMPSIGMASGYGSSHSQPSSGSYGAPSYGPPSSLSAPQSYRHSTDAAPSVQSTQYYNDGKPAVSNYS
ncbi:hypothetical protein QM012_000661 [Aureobasidium pullulans]|uniref:Uncharacterized protein n=1 Tax=Aureobasidium pullulans TaxID=5580 RepID=A0ABR0TW83_AURPU